MNDSLKGQAFELSLIEYKKAIKAIKRKCIAKYGVRAAEWFGV